MKSLLKNKKVKSVEGDANYDDLFIDLEPGWCFEEAGVHCFGAETSKEAKENLYRIKKCNCPQCK